MEYYTHNGRKYLNADTAKLRFKHLITMAVSNGGYLRVTRRKARNITTIKNAIRWFDRNRPNMILVSFTDNLEPVNLIDSIRMDATVYFK